MRRLLPHVGLFVLIALVYVGGGLDPLERRLLDARFRLAARPASGDVVLVAIDSKSLQTLNHWPWPRGYHATLLENLLDAGARRVAFDIDFSSRSLAPDEDLELIRVLRAAPGRVVLPVFQQREPTASGQARLMTTEPLPELRRHAALGTINIQPEPDGLTRRYRMAERLDWRVLPAFAARLAGRAAHHGEAFFIDFGIEPGSVPRWSYLDVLSGQFAAEQIEGRIVIVGATAVELGDQVAVPRFTALPGPLVQALAFESIVQNRMLQPVGRWLGLLVALVLALVVVPWLQRVSWRRGLVAVLALVTGIFGLAALVQSATPWVLEISPWLLMLAGAYGWGLLRRIDQQGLVLWMQGKQMRRTENLMRHVVENSFDAILTLDEDGRLETLNPAAREMFGWSAAMPAVMRVDEVVRIPEELAGSEPGEVLRRRDSLCEAVGRRADGSEFPLEISVTTIVNDGERRWVVFLRDITDRKAQQQALEHRATHDALTGLPNRYMLAQRVESALAASRDDGEPVAFLVLDLDRFREINDTLGHHVGDRVLRLIGKRLQSALRPTDTIARIGGDEFAVLLPATELSRSRQVAQRLIETLERPFRVEALSLQVDTSIGIALFPDHGEDATKLIQRADVAMYVAKRARSAVGVYDEAHDFTSERRLTLTGALRGAIENDQLELHYQPKISSRADRVVGAEALVRWTHSEYGNISPDEFIGLAEQTGLIEPLTHWVLDSALQRCVQWRAEGHDLEISVNVSARNLLDEQLPALLREMLRNKHAEPDWLTLELTESVIMEDPERALEVVRELQRLGVHISIDDFGTGYSSLAYLKKLSADELKIDKSFVMEMDRNQDDAEIVRSTIELAHNLGLHVVAEGVERQEIWQTLKHLGCDVGQGYLFSKPLPADDFIEQLARDESPQPAGYPASL
jgi:diguanylate cyclase (GGDEF)-like protein/PAS domain S-box-containing protein